MDVHPCLSILTPERKIRNKHPRNHLSVTCLHTTCLQWLLAGNLSVFSKDSRHKIVTCTEEGRPPTQKHKPLKGRFFKVKRTHRDWRKVRNVDKNTPYGLYVQTASFSMCHRHRLFLPFRNSPRTPDLLPWSVGAKTPSYVAAKIWWQSCVHLLCFVFIKLRLMAGINKPR